MVLLDLIKTHKIYDLEQERSNGMPTIGLTKPGYYYFLHKHHENSYNPAEEGPRTGALGLVVTTDHMGTHIDALCHIASDLKLYGGVPVDRETETLFGFTKHGAETIAPIMRRGVLLDVASYKKVEQLPEKYEITRDDIEATCNLEDVDVQQGDVVLVRTGYGRHWLDSARYLKGAGVSKEASIWLASRKVHAVGVDNLGWELQGVRDPDTKSTSFCHLLLIVQNGIYIIENLYLEELARDCCHKFVFIALPLKCKGSTGTPARPIALARR